MERKTLNRSWQYQVALPNIESASKHHFKIDEDLFNSPEFQQFRQLIIQKGKTIFENAETRIRLLKASDFVSLDQRVGLAFFVNSCFDKGMGLSGTNIADNPNGQLKFLEIDNQLVSFVGEKIMDDKFNRKIYYLDIAGTLKGKRGTGVGRNLGEIALLTEIENSTKDIVFLSRTQNPMLVSMAREMLPEGVCLAPFYCEPSTEIIESVNWMIENGHMSRNNRSDSYFDGNQSMISWGSYGLVGDGSTWEDMTKQLKNLDWNRPTGILMQKYLAKHGTTIEEAKLKGHAFVIGALIKI